MVTTTLRAYLDDLNGLLEQEALEEVIGHCRHILQHFPKNIETYRVLGRALLERGRHDEASDVFRRVLSAVPDDLSAHLGLCEANRIGNLPLAIWHLEHAFEQEPNNVVLQDELKQLYSVRDGVSPERIQMTRGALARIYFRSRLYDEATFELRAALDESPERTDLLVLLARTFWENEHLVEASEVALKVLETLPDSLEANRILTALWLSCGRPNEAQPFLASLEQLDPFMAWQAVYPAGPEVPAEAFPIPRLQWNARTAAALATDVPDWVASIGDVLEAPQTVALSDSAETFKPIGVDPTGTFTMPITESAGILPTRRITGRLGTPDQPPKEQEEVPDWFRDIAEQTGYSAPQSRSGTPAESTASPAQAETEIPDWLKDVVDTSPAEPVEIDPIAWLDTGLLPALEEESPAPAEPGAIDPMAWLQTGPLPDLGEATPPPAQPPAAQRASWLVTGSLPAVDEVGAPSAEPEADEPMPHLPQTAALVPTDEMGSTGEAAQETSQPIFTAESQPVDMFDVNWLLDDSTPAATAEGLSGEFAAEMEQPEPQSAADLLDGIGPDWPEADAAQQQAEESPEIAAPSQLQIEPQPELPPATDDPDWLRQSMSLSESLVTESEQDARELSAAEMANESDIDLDWLSAIPAAHAAAQPGEPPADGLDWLDSLPPTLAQPEAEPHAPAEGLDWLSQVAEPTEPGLAGEIADVLQDDFGILGAGENLELEPGLGRPSEELTPVEEEQADPMAWYKQFTEEQPTAPEPTEMPEYEAQADFAAQELAEVKTLAGEQLDEGGELQTEVPTAQGGLTPEDVLAWLNSPQQPETMPAPDALDWLGEQQTQPEPQNWLSSLGVAESPPEPPAASLSAGVSTPESPALPEVPVEDEWLLAFEPESPPSPPPVSTLLEPLEGTEAAALEASRVDEQTSVDDRAQEEASAAPPAEPQEDLPLYKRAVTGTLPRLDERALFAEAESAGVDQPAESEPVAGLSGAPEWMHEAELGWAAVEDEEEAAPEESEAFDSLIRQTAERANQPPQIQTGVLDEGFTPDWLAGLAEAEQEEVAASAAQESAAPGSDWLEGVGFEEVASDDLAAAAPEIESGEEHAVEGEMPDWLLAMAPSIQPFAQSPSSSIPLDQLDFSSLEAEQNEVAQPENLVNTGSTKPTTPTESGPKFSFKREPAWKRKAGTTGEAPKLGDSGETPPTLRRPREEGE